MKIVSFAVEIKTVELFGLLFHIKLVCSWQRRLPGLNIVQLVEEVILLGRLWIMALVVLKMDVDERHLLLRHWRESAEVWRWVWWSITVAWVVLREFWIVTNFGLLLFICRWGGQPSWLPSMRKQWPGKPLLYGIGTLLVTVGTARHPWPASNV